MLAYSFPQRRAGSVAHIQGLGRRSAAMLAVALNHVRCTGAQYPCGSDADCNYPACVRLYSQPYFYHLYSIYSISLSPFGDVLNFKTGLAPISSEKSCSPFMPLHGCNRNVSFSFIASDVRPIPPARLASSPGRLRPPRRHPAEREWPPPTPARDLAGRERLVSAPRARPVVLPRPHKIAWTSPLAHPACLFTEAQSSQYQPRAVSFCFSPLTCARSRRHGRRHLPVGSSPSRST